MPFSLSQLRTMPVTAALGILLWVLAWAGFLGVVYMVFTDVAKDIRNLAIAVIVLTVFLVRAANWSRIIALMANLLAIVFLGFLSFVMGSAGTSGTAFMVADLFVFCASSYFLFIAPTANFFKFHSQPASPETQSKKDQDPKAR